MDRWNFYFVVVCIVLAFTTMTACQPSLDERNANGSSAEAAAGPENVSAEQILSLMKAVYSTAKNYRDEGELLLSYRKDGLRTEEPQRWSTTWSVDGKMYCEIFGAQLTGDGQRLACFIYDIDTANMDGQRMVKLYSNDQPPIVDVFDDPIASVFMGGFLDLPLNEQDSKLRGKLVPAPLSLLTNQVPCAWIQNPVGLERLPDESVDQKACYVIRSLADGLGCDLWIDKSTGLLVQMSLPLKLLDPQVMAAPNIVDLKILARFKNAAINVNIDPSTFELRARKNSTAIRSFVALPEALPVESIGQVVAGFRLVQPDGKKVDHLHFDGNPTALLWLGGDNSYPAIDDLNDLAKSLPPDQFNFGIVYSDAELTAGPKQPHLVRPELTAAAANSEVLMFYDPGLSASTELAIRNIPSVVLLDGDSRVQFATEAINQTWPQDLAAAMKRVAAGDDLALEMLTQYQQIMTEYKAELLRADASSLLPSHALSRTDSAANSGDRRAASSLPTRNTAPVLVSSRVWVNREFKQPGNISVTCGDRLKISVLDGLRTIVELDDEGKSLGRRELDLPDSVGVSRIRSTHDGRRQVVFTPLSQRAFVFDSKWQSDRVYTRATDQVNSEISDVFVFEDEPDNSFLIVAKKDAGVALFSLDKKNKPVDAISDLTADSIVLSKQRFFFVQQGKLKSRAFEAGSNIVGSSQKYRFERVSCLLHSTQANVLATAFDGQHWNAVCLDHNLNIRWSSPIGSQLFESFIDPIGVVKIPDMARNQNDGMKADFAIACTDNTVHVFNEEVGWLADVRLNGPPSGVALSNFEGKTLLFVSSGSSVECWALE